MSLKGAGIDVPVEATQHLQQARTPMSLEWVAVTIGVVILVAVVALFRFRSKPASERDDSIAWRLVEQDELPQLHAYCLSHLDPSISSLDAMRAWHLRNPTIFHVLSGASLIETPEQIRGYFALLPLNVGGANAILASDVTGSSLREEHICPPADSRRPLRGDDRVALLYIGGIAAAPNYSVRAVLRLRAAIAAYRTLSMSGANQRELLLAARPISTKGASFLRAFEFSKAGYGPTSGLDCLYQRGIANDSHDLPQASHHSRLAGGALPHGSGSTRYFETSYGVFQGGGCRAVAFAGAYLEAAKRGVHFTRLAGTSAGSIAAVLIAAGATPNDLLKRLRELDFANLLAPPELGAPGISAFRHFTFSLLLRISSAVWPSKSEYLAYFRGRGIYSSVEIERWVERQLRELLGRQEPIKFKHIPTPLSIVATDLKTRTVTTWHSEENAEREVAQVVRASCSIPFYFQPALSWQYVDGGVLSNLPAFVFRSRSNKDQYPDRTLAFCLTSERESSNVPSSTREYLNALTTSVIDGAQELQLGLLDDVYPIFIPTEGVEATDFDKITPDTVERLIFSGITSTARFFDSEQVHVDHPKFVRRTYRGDSGALLALLDASRGAREEIVLVSEDSEIFREFVPAILAARLQGLRVVLVSGSPGPSGNLDALLRRAGVAIDVEPTLAVSAGFVDPESVERAFCLHRYADDGWTAYAGECDAPAIDALLRSMPTVMTRLRQAASASSALKLDEVAPDAAVISEARRGHGLSNGDSVALEKVYVRDLRCTKTRISKLKYKQALQLARAYERAEIDPFGCVAVDRADSKTWMLPPIIDHVGGRYFIREGHARALWAYNRRQTTIKAVVVRDSQHALVDLGPLPNLIIAAE